MTELDFTAASVIFAWAKCVECLWPALSQLPAIFLHGHIHPLLNIPHFVAEKKTASR